MLLTCTSEYVNYGGRGRDFADPLRHLLIEVPAAPVTNYKDQSTLFAHAEIPLLGLQFQ
jgi:hypothetical protein